MQIYKQISVIAALAVAIGAMMVPGAPAAFAHHHVSIHQHISQVNLCTGGSLCDNQAHNHADVDLPNYSSNHVHISQHIDQTNVCDASLCANDATNNANVN